MMTAVDAAFADGMDVAVLGLTIPIVFTVHDLCTGGPCDPWAAEVETAAAGGMAIVVAAGNDCGAGPHNINTPGVAPSGITVGAAPRRHTVVAFGSAFAVVGGRLALCSCQAALATARP